MSLWYINDHHFLERFSKSIFASLLLPDDGSRILKPVDNYSSLIIIIKLLKKSVDCRFIFRQEMCNWKIPKQILFYASLLTSTSIYRNKLFSYIKMEVWHPLFIHAMYKFTLMWTTANQNNVVKISICHVTYILFWTTNFLGNKFKVQ